MCPLCLSTAAWVIAGVTSTGGVAALAVSKRTTASDKDVAGPTPEIPQRANCSTTKESE